MHDLVGLIAVLGTFGVAPLIVHLRSRHKLRLRELELRAQALEAGRPMALAEE